MKKVIYTLISVLIISFLIFVLFNKNLFFKENVEKSVENVEKQSNGNNIGSNESYQCSVENKKITPDTILEPTFIKGIMIVNKKYPLPKSYNKGENPEARKQVNKLIKDMQDKGLNVSNQTSGFRSYEYQAKLYNNYVKGHGKEAADKFSARPGYSEHQSGLAFDLIDNQGNLLGAEETNNSSKKAAEWLAENAHNYGFIVRYKEEFKNETGYNAETWHLRYVGEEVAKKLYSENISLERYLGVQGGDYCE